LEELGKFDVIFLGDVGVEEGQLTSEDCQRIRLPKIANELKA